MDTNDRLIMISFDGEQAVELSKLGFDEAIDLLEAALTLRDQREERLTNARSRHMPSRASSNGSVAQEQPKPRRGAPTLEERARKASGETLSARQQQIADEAEAAQ